MTEGVAVGKTCSVKLRPTLEDILRSLGYLTIMVWAVLFMFFPSPVFMFALDATVRQAWMAATIFGALVALTGSLTRIDLKMEFPGLLICMGGPVFYSVSQFYFIIFPASTDIPIDRNALAVYALLPAILLLPRTVGLFIEARRMKRINTQAGRAK